ncbi:unnamed protein product [Ectocarpus sp. 12 AP-2014]
MGAYATKMNKSGDEMKDLPEHVFFVTRCVSPWYMGIVEALANGLARHRGVGYARFNLRFFVSLIVRQACDAADKDEKGYTTCKLEKHSELERPAFAVGSWSSRTVKK